MLLDGPQCTTLRDTVLYVPDGHQIRNVGACQGSIISLVCTVCGTFSWPTVTPHCAIRTVLGDCAGADAESTLLVARPSAVPRPHRLRPTHNPHAQSGYRASSAKAELAESGGSRLSVHIHQGAT